MGLGAFSIHVMWVQANGTVPGSNKVVGSNIASDTSAMGHCGFMCASNEKLGKSTDTNQTAGIGGTTTNACWTAALPILDAT